MPSDFSRTMRSLDERRPRPLRLVSALVLLGAWAAWMGGARVNVYATTTQARLEVRHLPSRVSAPEGGRITALRVELGRAVTEGEVLVELDASVERRRLDEELARVASLEPKVEAVRAQITAADEVRRTRWRLNGLSTDRATLQRHEAETVSARQEQLGVMNKSLSDNELLSRSDKIKADGELLDSRLKVDSATLEISRLGATQQYDDKQELARIADLGRLLADLGAERTASLAAAETARAQIERRQVRAAATGKLGNIAALQIGDVLKAGDVIATVIPSDDVHVVAEFPPSDVGRVLPGQRARVRLAGFSWAQYGMLDAVVTDVASEPRDGTVRAELVIEADAAPVVPIQHGLPGSVDVEVERASPWTLVLRTVGSSVTRPPKVPASTNPVARAGNP
jgi:multidrug resistance efflux pump